MEIEPLLRDVEDYATHSYKYISIYNRPLSNTYWLISDDDTEENSDGPENSSHRDTSK